jgi:hypothetical protein
VCCKINLEILAWIYRHSRAVKRKKVNCKKIIALFSGAVKNK